MVTPQAACLPKANALYCLTGGKIADASPKHSTLSWLLKRQTWSGPITIVRE